MSDQDTATVGRRARRRVIPDRMRQIEAAALATAERVAALECAMRADVASLREELVRLSERAASRGDVAAAREAAEGAVREAASGLRVDARAVAGAAEGSLCRRHADLRGLVVGLAWLGLGCFLALVALLVALLVVA